MAHRKSPTLPPLRFGNGDVIVKLSADPSKWLLLHADVLRAASPSFFALSLQTKWGRHKRIVLPGSKEEKEVYTLAMVAKDGSFFLEAGAEYCEIEILPDGTYVASECFIESDLNALEVYRYDISGALAKPVSVADATAADYHAMFALLYQTITNDQVTANQILLSPEQSDVKALYDIRNSTISHLANVLCLAHYHGLYSQIAPGIETLLMSIEGLFLDSEEAAPATDVNSRELMAMAKLFGNRDLYEDVLRHRLLSPSFLRHSDLSPRSEMLGIDEDAAQTLVETCAKLQEQELKDLKSTLQLLSLAPVTYYDGSSRENEEVRVTLSNAMDHRRGSQDPRALQVESIALQIYGQWVTQITQVTYYGEASILVRKKDGRTRPRPIRSFDEAVESLMKAAKSDDPSTLFGHKVPEHYARIWFPTAHERRKFAQEVRAKVAEIVREAAQKVKDWSRRSTFTHFDSSGTGSRWVLDSARSGLFYDSTLTFIPVPEKFPWSKDEKKRDRRSRDPRWVGQDHVNITQPQVLPTVSTEPASTSWLQTLGLLVSPYIASLYGRSVSDRVCLRGQMAAVPV